jgi:DNA topoisomerase-2
LDFIQTIKTPILKATKNKKVIEFYTQQDYDKWKSTVNTAGYNIKYYKGLGTSTKQDAQDTFKRYEELRSQYHYKDEKCDEAILLAFQKDKNIKSTKGTDNMSEGSSNEIMKCTDKRKKWLSKYNKDSYIDTKNKKISYQDFINKDLIHFSIYDNLRSIPSFCDGLKPSQRKILHYMLKNNIKKAIKVAQLSGYVSAETSYHHGETSLQQAIISMAQTFVGSNNINLLYPDGNHGTRLQGGKDAASPRYIFTYLENISNCIFDSKDAPLLNYLEDDGQMVEPEWFVPVIPMVLVNGCEGIGTGYSTFIPPHNPKDIIANIIRLIDDKEALPMKPYFRGFNGDVIDNENGSYSTKGKWEKISSNEIKITELPIGVWVTSYKEFLESMIDGNANGKKKQIVLKDVKNLTYDENDGIEFIIEFKDASVLDKLIKTNLLEKELKLLKNFNVNNMYLFDDNCVPVKYPDTTAILLDFYDLRLEFYGRRKRYLVAKLEKELNILNAKTRFISEYIEGQIEINKKSKENVISILEEKGFPKYSESNESGSYDYLIHMQMVSLTLEKINELQKQRNQKEIELKELLAKTEKELWKMDLNKISELKN